MRKLALWRDMMKMKNNELMNKIMEARKNQQNVLEFKHNGSNVKIKIKSVCEKGVMNTSHSS